MTRLAAQVSKEFWQHLIAAGPALIAHRGASAVRPENTAAAFEYAQVLGAQVIECDVTLSADKQGVIIHDDSLKRTTDGRGKVASKTLEELQSMDAGSWFSSDYAGERLLSITQLLTLLQRIRIGANVELKGDDAIADELVANVEAAIKHYDLPLLFSSFSMPMNQALASQLPDWPRGLLRHDNLKHWQRDAESLQVFSVHAHHALLDAQQCKSIRDAGYALFAYTVNEPQLAKQLFAWGVQGVFTDNIATMKQGMHS